MSTRSYIGIENNDGSVDFVYCHFDGYPTGVGAGLVNLGRRQARALINQGDLRTLTEPFQTPGSKLFEGFRHSGSLDKFRRTAQREVSFGYLINRHGTWKVCSGKLTFVNLKQLLKHCEPHLLGDENTFAWRTSQPMT